MPVTIFLGARSIGKEVLRGDLFVRERRNLGSLSCVLNCDCADIAITIEVDNCILVEILCFLYIGPTEFDV